MPPIKYGDATIVSGDITVPITVTYNSTEIANITNPGTYTLKCAKKKMATDVVIGSHTLKCSGKLMSGDVAIEATQISVPEVESMWNE